MADKAPFWVEPVMRFGYGARGAVYSVVGILAFLAAMRGGRSEGTEASLSTLTTEPLGLGALWIIALGLFAYAIWRWMDAVMDLDAHGTDAKGLLSRAGLCITGVIHAALGVSVAFMAAGQSSGAGGDGRAEDWTAQLMQVPFGRWLVAIVGLITIGTGIYYGYKAISEKYKSRLRRTAVTERLNPVIKAGVLSHGLVVTMIGGFLVYAALTANPNEAGGLGQALQTIGSLAFGRILLLILTAGLIGFAVYCFIEARYRILPSYAGPDIRTLARKANPAG